MTGAPTSSSYSTSIFYDSEKGMLFIVFLCSVVAGLLIIIAKDLVSRVMPAAAEEIYILVFLIVAQLLIAARSRPRLVQKLVEMILPREVLQVAQPFSVQKESFHQRKQSSRASEEGECAGNAVNHFELSQLRIAARANDLSACEAVMKKLKSEKGTLRADCYGLLIAAYSRAGRPDGCHRWLSEQIESEVGTPSLTTFNLAITAFAKDGHVERAEYWLRRMKLLGVTPDSTTYNATIDTCARTCGVARAEAWHGQMVDNGVVATLVTYKSLLHACAKHGDWSRAEIWLGKALSATEDPGTICYNFVIHACSVAHNFDRAFFWLGEMREHGVDRTVHSYSCVIDHLAKAGSFDQALKLLRTMIEDGVEPDSVCMAILLNSCAKGGHKDRASALYDTLSRCSVPAAAVCYNMMISMHAEDGQAADVLRLLELVAIQRVQPDRATYNSAFKTFALCADACSAVALYLHLDAIGLDNEQAALHATLDVCSRTKTVSCAESLLSQKLASGKQLDAQSLSAFFQMFASSGDTAKIDKWLTRTERLQCKPSAIAFVPIVNLYAKSAEARQIEHVLKAMRRHAIKPTVPMYNALLSAFASNAEADIAKEWLELMLTEGVKADIASYASVVHACAKAGNLGLAEKCMQSMIDNSVTPNIVAHNSMINACARQGEVGRAEEWFQRMEENGIAPNLSTFNSMLNACSKAGDIRSLEAWFSRMRKHGITPDAVSFSTIIHACAQASDASSAEYYLNSMRKECPRSRTYPGKRDSDSFCANSVIQAFANSGDHLNAAKWIDVCLEEHIEVGVASFTLVINVFVREGEAEQAERYLLRMTAEGHAVTRGVVRNAEALACLWTRRGSHDRAAAVRKCVQQQTVDTRKNNKDSKRVSKTKSSSLDLSSLPSCSGNDAEASSVQRQRLKSSEEPRAQVVPPWRAGRSKRS